MFTISEKLAMLTKFKNAIAESLRSWIPTSFEIFDSLDEVRAELLPCAVISFDKGVNFDALYENVYECSASLTVDLFLSLNEEIPISASDKLSETLSKNLLLDPALRDMCQSIELKETSAQNFTGEHQLRILFHDFMLKFLWSPDVSKA